jgi:hypothetical protein
MITLSKKDFYVMLASLGLINSITLSIATSLLVVTLLMSVGFFVNTSFAQGNQTNQSGGGGQNTTLQVEGTSGVNQSIARNESAGGGGIAPG